MIPSTLCLQKITLSCGEQTAHSILGAIILCVCVCRISDGLDIEMRRYHDLLASALSSWVGGKDFNLKAGDSGKRTRLQFRVTSVLQL